MREMIVEMELYYDNWENANGLGLNGYIVRETILSTHENVTMLNRITEMRELARVRLYEKNLDQPDFHRLCQALRMI